MEETKKKFYKRWWFWALIVLFIVVGLSGSTGSSTPPTSQGTETVQAPAPITVTAYQLASAYKENEVAADATYKDKTVQISGAVETIAKDITDTPYIAFATENQYDIINRVQCMFSKQDTTVLAEVKKGQKITLEGRVSGALGNIIVKDCKVVQ